jgi:predicted O-methyltransferase YrrM
MQTSKDYFLTIFTEERDFLKTILEKSALRKIPVIEIEAGRLLEVVSLIYRPKEVLEIGCGIGFSTYFILKNLHGARYTGIDLNASRLSEAKQFIQSRFSGQETNFIAGNALSILPILTMDFDLVFIDGAKHEYPQYFEAIISKTKKNSVIIADNILYKNKVLKKNILKRDTNSVHGIKKFIELISNKKLFDTTIIDIGDGLSVSVKKI